MKVRVIKKVFYGGARRKPGETLNVPDQDAGDWFEVIDKGPAKTTKEKPAGA